MRLFNRLFPREEKSSSVGHTLVVSPGQPVWSPREYKAFSREAYQMNVVAYQAVNRVADAVAGIDWQVYKNDKEQDGHPIEVLLKRPNPHQSGKEYFRALVSYYLLSGNSYAEAIRVGGDIKEMYQLRPDRMQIVPSETGEPSKFIHKGANSKATIFPAVDEAIWHMKAFNPTDDWYGQSPIEAGAFAIDQSNEAMKWIQALLQNSSRPSGALKVPADKALSADEVAALKDEITESYTGSKHGGRPMLLQGGMDWVQLGLSPTDMGILETKFSASRDIALAFGVPPQLIGIPGDNTYANYSEARISFWEDTVIPLVDLIAADLTAWLGRREGVEIRPDLEKVPAIVEKRQSLWQMIDASTDLTVNEKRDLKGYAKIKGGDVLLVGSGQIGLEDAGASLSLGLSEQTEAAPAEGTEVVLGGQPSGVDVQRQALNGAQMASLQAAIQAVSDGLLPADSAIEMLLVAIPTLTRQQVQAMIKPAESFESLNPDVDNKALRVVAGYGYETAT